MSQSHLIRLDNCVCVAMLCLLTSCGSDKTSSSTCDSSDAGCVAAGGPGERG